MKPRKKGSGGARPGAGKKRTGKGLVIIKSVSLYEVEWQDLAKLGGHTKAIRELLRFHKEHTKPPDPAE